MAERESWWYWFRRSLSDSNEISEAISQVTESNTSASNLSGPRYNFATGRYNYSQWIRLCRFSSHSNPLSHEILEGVILNEWTVLFNTNTQSSLSRFRMLPFHFKHVIVAYITNIANLNTPCVLYFFTFRLCFELAGCILSTCAWIHFAWCFMILCGIFQTNSQFIRAVILKRWVITDKATIFWYCGWKF